METCDSKGYYFRHLQYVVLLLAIVLTGCSTLRLTYSQSPTLVYFWLNKYISLNSRQSKAIRNDLRKFIEWHRNTQLEVYAQMLVRTRQQFAAGETTPADLRRKYEEVRAVAQVSVTKALPGMVDLAMSIKPEQIKRIERKFISNNETYRREFIDATAESIQEKRFEKSMEELEEWFGDWTSEQVSFLRQASNARPLNNQLVLEERILRQNKILAFLRKIHEEKLSKEETTVLLSELIKNVLAPSEYSQNKNFYNESLEGNLNFASTAVLLAPPEQKARAQKRMTDLARDFRALSAIK